MKIIRAMSTKRLALALAGIMLATAVGAQQPLKGARIAGNRCSTPTRMSRTSASGGPEPTDADVP